MELLTHKFHTLRPWLLAALLTLLTAVALQRAQAGGDHYYPPVTDTLVLEECGSCHFAYAPALLPARSWSKMMGSLQGHFGSDASLDAAVATRIQQYLTTHAADAAGLRYGEKWQRGVGNTTPLRITELPQWQRKHRKVSDADWRQARSRANCNACHRDAASGFYED